MFIWSADGATFIRYTGQSSMVGYGPLVDTRVTLTFSGTGAVVSDATTQALTGANIRGNTGANTARACTRSGASVPAVSSLTVNVLIEASDAGSGAWQPADTYFGTTATHRQGDGSTEVDRSHVDLAFYTSSCGDSQVDGTEQCDLGRLERQRDVVLHRDVPVPRAAGRSAARRRACATCRKPARARARRVRPTAS